ncbi:MAG TPA: histidine kinase [Draconibacterium sp.]|nr:histidine kinase [Draconibacterium sp.]
MTKSRLYYRFKFIGHVIFWLASITLLTLIFYFYDEEINLNLVEKSIITNVFFAMAVYINLYLLIPKFLKQKNYIFYVFWLIVLVTAVSVIIQLLFIYPLRKTLGIDRFSHFNLNLHSAYFFSTLLYVGITSFLKLIKDWLSMQDINLKLVKIEQQKLEAELKTLKGQLNPHFLFNSLNNIYSLALINSDKVPELILKLSDLMRHIIYDSKENYISIEKELEFVNNFIELQKIRTSDQTKIKYNIVGKIPSAKIAPLLFEPFIDNAFKHGLPGAENSDYIHITFNFLETDKIIFEIENNFETIFTQKQANSGIGLNNVKKRLKLLYQPNDFKLTILKKDNIHRVSLELKLIENGNKGNNNR